jgi:hypothetical protein
MNHDCCVGSTTCYEEYHILVCALGGTKQYGTRRDISNMPISPLILTWGNYSGTP